MRRWLLIVIVLVSGLGVPVITPAIHAQSQDIDTFITGLMALYDIPGAGVALVHNGQVITAQGYGVRSTETGEPVTADTLFSIGSVTKSFTALGVAQLVDQGRVSLDAPVMTYLPGFQLADPAAAQTVTVRQLLAQTSGLPGTGDSAWYSGRITTLKEAVDYAAQLGLAAAPGTKHIYSNYNYAIAGYLIEQVTGQTWPDTTREHIFQPLGMTAANFDIDTMQQTDNYALPHTLDILKGMQPQAFVSLAGIASAGAINASARDMANYLLFQLGDGTFNGLPLLSAGMMAEMHTLQAAYPPMPPVGPTGFQTKGYALGWFVADFYGIPVIWHNGSIDGFYTMAMFVPSANAGVVVLSNAGLGTGSLFTLAASLGLLEQVTGMQTNRDVVAALNEEAAFDPADRQAKLDAARAYQANPADWSLLLGAYSGAYGAITVEQGEGKMIMNLERAAGFELVPYAPGGFLVANIPTEGLISTFSFVTDAGGAVTLYQDGIEIGKKTP